jgi:hypothetical protein
VLQRSFGTAHRSYTSVIVILNASQALLRSFLKLVVGVSLPYFFQLHNLLEFQVSHFLEHDLARFLSNPVDELLLLDQWVPRFWLPFQIHVFLVLHTGSSAENHCRFISFLDSDEALIQIHWRFHRYNTTRPCRQTRFQGALQLRYAWP